MICKHNDNLALLGRRYEDIGVSQEFEFLP